MYKKRIYQTSVYNDDLIRFQTDYYESNLFICAKNNLQKEALTTLKQYHTQITNHIEKNPLFKDTLEPLPPDKNAPAIIKKMLSAAKKANVGPMATVAGAIAEFIGKDLLNFSDEIIVENGGDIFICVKKDRKIGIFSGINSIYNQLSLKITAIDTPCGICTSSGKLGHSLSFGQSKATIVLAKSAAVADGFATSIGNVIQEDADVPKILKNLKKNKAILGAVIITENHFGAYGKVQFEIIDKPV
ncbi:MAG: UPF0280 family protein [PVC group bacterium]|nr:UPF0280 family protein [PVC group bacterium]